ncbi:ATP-binding cassette domain-containing protein [Georgenia deserti]|uniref:ATP-binding cassette domain-containing protein n=1 Tax=Georgenia deserti TaxID=2093781 RepID=A0ABW4L5B9_9MICO
MTTPILSVTGLHKTFTLHATGRVITSLDGVALDVGPGEHVAVAGASGAGKSSLLRCVYRTYLPDAGRVTLRTGSGPVELTTLPDRQLARLRGREIGYVAQFLAAPPRTGPLQHVRTAARRRGLEADAAEDAAVGTLRRLGIDEPLWAVDCSVLSGGERQRVNLAAGIVSPPRLLLLDEPVSALDPGNRERALAEIDTLARREVSVLAVYHDMRIIRRLATRAVVMDRGRVLADGSPETILAQHHTALEEVA